MQRMLWWVHQICAMWDPEIDKGSFLCPECLMHPAAKQCPAGRAALRPAKHSRGAHEPLHRAHA